MKSIKINGINIEYKKGKEPKVIYLVVKYDKNFYV